MGAGACSGQGIFPPGAIIESTTNQLRRQQAALTEEGRAAIAEAEAKQKAANAGRDFVASLKQQADSIGKTRAELLEMKAAQLGVSAEATPFINALKQQEQALKKQQNAMGTAGISAGQYKMAMRQLPMQITDVVTSLASGMPIWLVAVQQGGQIKDSFGGLSNTFKVLLSYINPLTVGAASLGIALAAIAKAGYDSGKRNENWRMRWC